MAETQTPSRADTPSAIPTKRNFEDEHAPSVSSPLNPNAPAPAPQPKARQQREKKDSLKKRESVGGARATPEAGNKKRKVEDERVGAPSPIRYNHELPKLSYQHTVRDQNMVSREPEPLFAPNGSELKRSTDHAENKKNFRYHPCAADPSMPHLRYYRKSDARPYGARMSLEDSDRSFLFDDSLTIATNEKGWRTGRANICAREGSFYYEVKILRGVRPEGSPVPNDLSASQALPHIRMGWARREAPLDSPVGFDPYSYGLTDIRLDPMHKSRGSKFLDDGSERNAFSKSKAKAKSKHKKDTNPGFSAEDHAREGDVIGLEIQLPSIALHRKIVEGNYNPAVDTDSGLMHPTVVSTPTNALEPEDTAPNIVRDQFPVPYRNQMYFESYDYRPSKAMEAYGDRGPHSRETPSTNHPDPTARCLPHSHIKVYKNGHRIGTAFRNLMAFLPPASAVNTSEKNARQGFDDGMAGYFPAISAFAGGVAQVNFGPEFWFPPAELAGGPKGPSARRSETPGTWLGLKKEDGVDVMETGQDGVWDEEQAIMEGRDPPRSRLRGVGERYNEQVAEDVMYDIMDEVDFYLQDGGVN